MGEGWEELENGGRGKGEKRRAKGAFRQIKIYYYTPE